MFFFMNSIAETPFDREIILIFSHFSYTSLSPPHQTHIHDISSHNNCINPHAMVCVTATVLSTLQTTTNNNDVDDDDVDDASHSHVIVTFTYCCRRRW